MLLLNKMDTTPAFRESGIKLDPSESSWSKAAHFPCWRLERRGSQVGWAPRRATRLLRDDRSRTNRTDTAGKAELKHSPVGNVENKTAELLASIFTSRTDSRHGIWQVGLLWMPTLNLRSTWCCYRTVYSSFRKHFRSARNSHFSPSKTGSTARSPWDWEAK